MLLVIIVILLSPLLASPLALDLSKTLGPALANRLHGSFLNLWVSTHHFLIRGADQCLSTTPRSSGHCLWSSTAYLLFLTEALGVVLGLYFLRERHHALHLSWSHSSLRLASTGNRSSRLRSLQSHFRLFPA